jgi:hypothetical protein
MIDYASKQLNKLRFCGISGFPISLYKLSFFFAVGIAISRGMVIILLAYILHLGSA